MRRIDSNFALLLVIAFMAFATACAGPGMVPPPEPRPGDRRPYVIGVPDVIRVVVWKNPELAVQLPVRSDGKISVPLIDDVQADSVESLRQVERRNARVGTDSSALDE